MPVGGAYCLREWLSTNRERQSEKRPGNVQELHEHLVAEYGYPGTYRSVLR